MNNQTNMKQMLENLPRLEYKEVIFFKDKEELIKANDELRNNNIINIVSRTLTQNYIDEINEYYYFRLNEILYPLYAGLIGSVIGFIIGLFMIQNDIAFGIFTSFLTVGKIGTITLVTGIFSLTSTFFIGILSLFRPIKDVEVGFHMLTIYTDIESKGKVNNIINNYDIIKIK